MKQTKLVWRLAVWRPVQIVWPESTIECWGCWAATFPLECWGRTKTRQTRLSPIRARPFAIHYRLNRPHGCNSAVSAEDGELCSARANMV